jgi:hypothetical protein
MTEQIESKVNDAGVRKQNVEAAVHWQPSSAPKDYWTIRVIEVLGRRSHARRTRRKERVRTESNSRDPAPRDIAGTQQAATDTLPRAEGLFARAVVEVGIDYPARFEAREPRVDYRGVTGKCALNVAR